jgi:site-specific DNA recombinase
VEAIHSGAMPLDLIATEQQRITSQLAGIEERLSATTATFDKIEANLARALDLARGCHAAYLAADPQLRRLFNQAFFTHLYIDDDGLHSDYTEPFDTLLDPDTLMLAEPSRLTARPARSPWPISSDSPRPAPTSTLVPPAGLEPAA